MRVKCIDNKNMEDCLTLGFVYTANDIGTGIRIINDKGDINTYPYYRFESIEENKIQQGLLIKSICNIKRQDKPTEEQDMVHHPNHYTYKSMECNKIIDIMCEGITEGEAYKLGAVIKYLYRYPKKNNPIQDLEKAKTYIDMIIDKQKNIKTI